METIIIGEVFDVTKVRRVCGTRTKKENRQLDRGNIYKIKQ